MLTPLAIDPGHPFPYLGNRSLCLIASIRPSIPSALPSTSLAVVHIPSQVVPRFVALPAPAGQYAFMLLEDVIRMQLPRLYHGYDILSCHAIRITRDADLQIPRGRAQDLLSSDRGEPARAPHGGGRPPAVRRRPAGRGADHPGRGAGARARGPLRGRGVHRLLRPLPALRGGRPPPAEGAPAAAAAGAGVRGGARRLRAPSGPATSSSTTPTSRSTPSSGSSGRRRSTRRCSRSR